MTYSIRACLSALLWILILYSGLQAQVAEEPVHLLSTGSGARAIGMGGAFNAIADDVTSLYWNPAGLSQIKGFEGHFEFETLNGREDFLRTRSNGLPSSAQLFSLSGSTPKAFAIAYGLEKKSNSFCFSFGWLRNDAIPNSYELIAPEILNLPLIDTQVETDISRQLEGGKDTLLFGFGSAFGKKYMLGFRVSVLRGQLNEVLDVRTVSLQEGMPNLSNILRETSEEEIRGTSFSVSFLSHLSKSFSIGGNLEFPYTQKSERHTLQEDFVFDASTFTESFTVSIPWSVDFGVSMKMNSSFVLAGSFQYSPWKDACIGPPDGNCSIPYPINRYYSHQSSLNHWRVGGEYNLRQFAFRAGFIIDDQPYTNSSLLDAPFGSDAPDDTQFYGSAFGAGYQTGRFSLNFGILREQGKARFKVPSGTHIDRGFIQSDLDFHHNRFLFGIGFRHRVPKS